MEARGSSGAAQLLQLQRLPSYCFSTQNSFGQLFFEWCRDFFIYWSAAQIQPRKLEDTPGNMEHASIQRFPARMRPELLPNTLKPILIHKTRKR